MGSGPRLSEEALRLRKGRDKEGANAERDGPHETLVGDQRERRAQAGKKLAVIKRLEGSAASLPSNAHNACMF